GLELPRDRYFSHSVPYQFEMPSLLLVLRRVRVQRHFAKGLIVFAERRRQCVLTGERREWSDHDPTEQFDRLGFDYRKRDSNGPALQTECGVAILQGAPADSRT